MTPDWRLFLKVVIPAILSSAASITAVYLKHRDATDETKRAYAALARNFNEHLVEHRAEHDDLLKLVGTVQALTTLVGGNRSPVEKPLTFEGTTGRKRVRGKWRVTTRTPAPPAATPPAEKVDEMNDQLQQVRGRKADLPPLPAAY